MPRRTPAPRALWPPCPHAAEQCPDCLFRRLGERIHRQLEARLVLALAEPHDRPAAVRALAWAYRWIDFIPFPPVRAEAAAGIEGSALVRAAHRALQRYDYVVDSVPAPADAKDSAP
jgi:hypothetical protein